MIKRLFLPLRAPLPGVLLGALLAFAPFLAAQGAGEEELPPLPPIRAKSYVLMDALSGRILHEKNSTLRLPPASLTKILAAYVLAREEAEGAVSYDDTVVISKAAWAQNFPGSSVMFLEVGDEVLLDDLHRGIAIASGNDASVAVAEHIAGSEDAFVEMMNFQARRLGMKDSFFSNSHGLPVVGEHYSSARDMAILAHALWRDYPAAYALYKEKSFRYNGIRQRNRNRLLWIDSSVDGLKTGFTQEAGYCLVASAKRRNTRLISVVLGAASEEGREQETRKLLLYGFRNYQTRQLFRRGEVVSTPRVWGGTRNRAQLEASAPVLLTVPRNHASQLRSVVVLNKEPLHAPLVRGEEYAQLELRLAGEVLHRVPLHSQNDIPRGSLWKRVRDRMGLLLRQLGILG